MLSDIVCTPSCHRQYRAPKVAYLLPIMHLSIYIYSSPAKARCRCLSREAAATSVVGATRRTGQPKSHLTRQPQPSHYIPRHRIPSNRIPTSTQWPQQSRRSTPKSGPTRSRTTSAQPVSRHPRMRRNTWLQEEAHCALRVPVVFLVEESGYKWEGCGRGVGRTIG